MGEYQIGWNSGSMEKNILSKFLFYFFTLTSLFIRMGTLVCKVANT